MNFPPNFIDRSPTDSDSTYKISEQLLHTDADGRKFQDFYKVIIDDSRIDFSSLLLILKKEFIKYPDTVDWCPFGCKLFGPIGYFFEYYRVYFEVYFYSEHLFFILIFIFIIPFLLI